MIEGYCRTNLDMPCYVKWPTKFVALPRIGDRVRSLEGNSELKVVGVTHTTKRHRLYNQEDETPIVEIELNK